MAERTQRAETTVRSDEHGAYGTVRNAQRSKANQLPPPSRETPVGFRPTADERDTLARLLADGMTQTEVLRRGLKLVEQERWLDRARAEAAALKNENLNDEPDAW